MKKTLRKLTALTMAAALVAVAALPVSATTNTIYVARGTGVGAIDSYSATATTNYDSGSYSGTLKVSATAYYKDAHGAISQIESGEKTADRGGIKVSLSWIPACIGYRLVSNHTVDYTTQSMTTYR